MGSVNRAKAADRAEERAALEAELKAIEAGAWPRDINDMFRWTAAPTSRFLPARENQRIEREHAAKCCRGGISYLDDVERRLAAGDPDLKGWEGWTPADA